jgi:cellulose synthase/poly-beta-1,6-N-acetylglucosamine synthase-like glycosyltransferase
MMTEQLLTLTLVTLFWTALGLVIYAYAGYPLLLALLARFCGSRPRARRAMAFELPTVSVLIAAYNEERWIARRIANALAQDYPADRLSVVIASDGSTDQTARIAEQWARKHPGRVLVHEFTTRRGKAAVLNEALPAVPGELVVLSDANTFFAPRAVRHLARWFASPSTSAVCGQLQLVDPATGSNVDSLYWRYENFLKQREAHLGALLGANGAIYAVRREQYLPIPDDTVIDDFVIPLQIKLKYGGAIVFDPAAIATEETPPHVSDEFRRRARIGAGGFQCLPRLWRLALPSSGWTSLAFVSHKVLRWFAPLLLLVALAANLALLGHVAYQIILLVQLTFAAAAALGCFVTGRGPLARTLRLTTLFASMNAALAVGFFRWVGGAQAAAWQRTAR